MNRKIINIRQEKEIKTGDGIFQAKVNSGM